MKCFMISRKYMILKNLYIIIFFGAVFYSIIKVQRLKGRTKCLSFEEMVIEEVNMENECLVNYIRTRRLSSPSTLPYNLTTRINNFNMKKIPSGPLQSFFHSRDDPWIEALIAVELFVPKKRQRYFLECGALDGIMFSTTLHLERFLNWTGILIEADDRFYSDLKNVHRKAYGIHACVSPSPFPTISVFKPSPIFYHNWKGSNLTNTNPGTGFIVRLPKEDQNEWNINGFIVKCVPIYTALLAANISEIDLFILDIQGVELDVLKTLPFEKVNVAIFMIEVDGKSKGKKELFRKFFQSKGYTFYDTFKGGLHPGDDIFIRNEYYKDEQDREKIKMNTTFKDIYQIITGIKDEDIDTIDLKSFIKSYIF